MVFIDTQEPWRNTLKSSIHQKILSQVKKIHSTHNQESS